MNCKFFSDSILLAVFSSCRLARSRSISMVSMLLLVTVQRRSRLPEMPRMISSSWASPCSVQLAAFACICWSVHGGAADAADTNESLGVGVVLVEEACNGRLQVRLINASVGCILFIKLPFDFFCVCFMECNQ